MTHRPALRRLAKARAAPEFHDSVDARRKHQNRRRDLARKLGVGQTPHLAERGIGPADGRRANGDTGRRRRHRGHAGVTRGIGGQYISYKGARQIGRWSAVARREGASKAERDKNWDKTVRDPCERASGRSIIGAVKTVRSNIETPAPP